MARPEFVDHWTVKWGDLLQVQPQVLGDKGMWAFREWIRESIAANKPYDKMVRELLTARGSSYENPPANYFRFTRDPKLAMENDHAALPGRAHGLRPVPRSSVRTLDAESVLPVGGVLRARSAFDAGYEVAKRSSTTSATTTR